MALRNRTIFAMIPWWAYLTMAILAYLVFHYLVPSLMSPSSFRLIGHAVPLLGSFISLILLLCAALMAFDAFRRRSLLDNQNGIDSTRSISWKEFEDLVAEAYKRKGYMVTETPFGADGGVDIILKKGTEKILVQCKQWKMKKVGVKVVRELYGVVIAEGASEGVVISSGIFTQEARTFARGKPLELIDGAGLLKMITEVQRRQMPVKTKAKDILCPLCGNSMVIRTAKKGNHVGDKFWGCTSFPKCRGTRPYNA
jgi:restriction system protein